MRLFSLMMCLALFSGCQNSPNVKRGVAQTSSTVQVRILPLFSTITFANKITFPIGSNTTTAIIGDVNSPPTGTLYCNFSVNSGAMLKSNQALQIKAGSSFSVQSATATPSYTYNQDGHAMIDRQKVIPVTYNLKNTSTNGTVIMKCDFVSYGNGARGPAPSYVVGNYKDFTIPVNGLSIVYGHGPSVLNLNPTVEILPIKYDQPLTNPSSDVSI